MVKCDTRGGGATDDSNLHTIYFHCIAYWKVQNKVMIEAASKDLINIYLTQFHHRFTAILDELYKRAGDVHEPPSMVKKRKDLIDAVKTLSQVKDELSKIQW